MPGGILRFSVLSFRTATARIITDLDGDGKAELIGGDDSSLLVWPGTGDPAYPATPIRMATPYPPNQLALMIFLQWFWKRMF